MVNNEAKLQYFDNYDSTNTKPFWEHCKPYFSNKHSKADTDIILSENGDLILKNDKIANTFNDYFGSIVENMNYITGMMKLSQYQKILIKHRIS